MAQIGHKGGMGVATTRLDKDGDDDEDVEDPKVRRNSAYHDIVL